MDITKTTEPRSDQQNFDDYVSGPKVVTVTGVKAGPPDQPVHLHLAEFPGRPYKPGLSMRRVLIAAWGKDANAYVGRQMKLYGDPSIKFGKDTVGGIRIAALSHLDKPVTVPLTVTRGKRAPFTVQPLETKPDTSVQDALTDINNATSLPALKAAWDLAGKRGVQGHPDVVAAKDERKTELSGETT